LRAAAEDVEVVAGDEEVVVDAQAAGFRMAAEAFLAVEAMFREEVAVSLVVTSASLAAAAVVYLVLAAVFLLAVAAPFRAAAILFPAEAASVPPAHTVFRKILRCSPI
jgi:hypothetical protein